MKKRLLSILLCCVMLLTLLPATAFAEGSAEEPPVCSCETVCTADNMNKECPVCGTESAIPQNCRQYVPVEDGTGENGSTEGADDPDGATELSAADQVQAMINALPSAEEVTEENAEEVEAQLDAIYEAAKKLSDEELDKLDLSRYNEVATVLADMAVIPTAVFAEATPTGIPLTQALLGTWLEDEDPQNPNSGKVYKMPAGSYYLAEDIYLVGDDASAWPLLISEGDVTLDLNGHVLDLKRKNISIYSNGKLTLTDSNTENLSHKFRVEDSGLWVWDEMQGTETVAGGVITGGTGVEGGSGTIGTLGGGVNVSGSLTMEGGSIVGCSANSGGGVDAGGDSFTMKSGTIEKCKAGNGGGVNLGNNSFTMTGGSIDGCTANNGGGIYVQPNSLCKLTMTGGSITNCTAAYAGGGVYLSSSGSQSGSFTMEGGSITDCTAGSALNAVHADGNFTDTNNKIDKNYVTGISARHTGTADDPILIGSAEGLKDFRDRVNKGETTLCAKLLCDIVLNDGTFNENGDWSKDGGAPESWTPIGTDTAYTDTFDGGGHTIKGLYVKDERIAGLFGEIGSISSGAIIQNVTVDGYVKGTSVAGGIAGMASNSATSIQNCVNQCYVVAEGSSGTGGIVGSFLTASISGCANTGAVSGTNYVGGIAGYATGGSISSCYNTGTVSGTDYVGGIAGYATGTTGTTGSISSCYNTGAVSGADQVGGVVGMLGTGADLNGCYNTGAVTVEGDSTVGSKTAFSVGGIAGLCADSNTISSCYNVGKVTYTGNCEQVNSGGIVGMNAISTVTDCYYLTGTAVNAVGENAGGTVTNVDARTKAEFADGTVLTLLKKNDTTNAWKDTCGYLAAADMTLPLLSWQTADAHDHTGGTATCKDKAICEICGESYGELNANNHSDLKYFPAVAATKTAEGNIEYWYCSGCGKYFADKDGNKEITKAQTVTAKLPSHTGGGTGAGTGNKPDNDAVASPNTGDSSKLALWSVTLCTSLAACLTLTKAQRRRKKEQ